jgi:glycosyltransferase involved in cell wall biosynthesis
MPDCTGCNSARPDGVDGKRLRILHTESSLGWGGQEIRVLGEARGMLARGHDVRLAAPAESRIAREAARYGVACTPVAIARKRVGGALALRALLARERCDVVNTHSSTDTWLAALACLTLASPPAIVRTRHISAPMPANAATRWLYNRATRLVVTTGEKVREQVIREASVDPARVVSIPTGIDLATFRPGERAAARAALGLPVAGFLVAIVATLRSWKGHRYLVEAFARLADRDARLAIVGDGPQREALERQVRDAGLAERVTFAGNRDEVAPWLQAADVFCLPSYANEGVPQALMQAMAAGLPVVTTPVGSISEIVADGRSGLIVPPEDSVALHAALERLRADPGLRDALARQAHREAEARFGEERMVERMEQVFRRAAG